uniref:Uncharacterized protein n=1 Tax=Knipowitschia caucasica TaxID=637954 RepID=A0AAV2J548_KNICA
MDAELEFYTRDSLCHCTETRVSEALIIQSCCSLEEHLQSQQNQQPYLLAVGRQKRKIDNFYVSIDKHLLPCQATRSIGAFDELFKAHFVFNVSYDAELQTSVPNLCWLQKAPQ